MSITSYTGAALSVLSSLTLTEWGILTGILTAIGTFLLNAWWGRRRDLREQQAHKLKLERYMHDRRQCDQPVVLNRRRQDGKINRSLVSAMSAASLVAALATAVVIHEGDGPTSVLPDTGETIHHAYPDPAHGWRVPTICQGRTRGVVPGMTATAAQCRLWLEAELSQEVINSLARNVKVPVTFSQAVALGMFRDNVGEGNFTASKLLRDVNAGRCHAAAREFNASPQIANGRPRIWQGRPIVDRRTGVVLLATGAPVMKWTTGGGIPLPGLIKRRAEERGLWEPDCTAWEDEK
ncbi:HP1 family phage holin [Thauera butanivorans]|uniref:HP1 family phage holin n=1 Tax=Thauera butanivorans TaxID=86174 RepID=UPI0009FC7526|nr:HP1 family phage holin [Thauera butanivorans]